MGEPEAADSVIIRPQPGPQERFLGTPADIAIYGGAAGGGKTWALLMEPLRHVANPHFGGVIFRRTTPQITNEGALWDESGKLYPLLGAEPKVGDLSWLFPSRAAVSFAHLEHEKNKLNWQGSQIPFIGWDELTHFSESQFWYLVSRNRSMCGVRPYVRATCNPDPDSFVATLIAWWIDQDTGFAIPERAGILRWFVRVGDAVVWADQPQDLASHINPADGQPIPPKSITFIPAKLSDNLALMKADPGYLANLMALHKVERERLLGGNWKVRPDDEAFFQQRVLLVDGLPVETPARCDAVFATIDTAVKKGAKNDGTAAIFWSVSRHASHPLVILGYDLIQIEGASLETWLPSVFGQLEHYAKLTKARVGSLGAYIEDKSSGSILLQQAARRGLPAQAIDSALTAMGKPERAISVSGYVTRGMVKISRPAYDQVVTYKGATANHLLRQITRFRLDVDGGADDALDCFCYGIAIALGNSEGF